MLSELIPAKPSDETNMANLEQGFSVPVSVPVLAAQPQVSNAPLTVSATPSSKAANGSGVVLKKPDYTFEIVVGLVIIYFVWKKYV